MRLGITFKCVLALLGGAALIGILVELWVEALKGRQAKSLDGKITHHQSVFSSLSEYANYVTSSDPDHQFRAAYGVLETSDFQYLWSYRQMSWVPICAVRPTSCMDDRGSYFICPPPSDDLSLIEI